MSIRSAFGNAGESVSEGVENIRNSRRTRLESGDFQSTMRQERQKFVESINNMGGRAVEAAWKGIIVPPLFPMWASLKAIAQKNYSAGDAVADSLKKFYEGAVSITQFAASVLVTAGRGAWLAGRYLIAR